MLINAGSLIGTTAVTSVLGFAYWWLAARQFPPHVVGLSSAAISAMMLLGSFCVLGLGTLLIGELPRQPGKEIALISSALILVGCVGGMVGAIFALLAPYISRNLQVLSTNVLAVGLFACGVSLTAMTIVLDQSLIGLLRGELQLWRNTLFAVAKLVALFLVGLWLVRTSGLLIYATWTLGNVLSLLPLAWPAALAVMKRGWRRYSYLPQWRLLRKLGRAALEHHLLNLTLQAPTLALPLLVTVLLSATMNAWFYVSWMVASFVLVAPNALTTVLYATNATQPAIIAPKIRMTLSLALVTSVLVNILLLFDTKQVLGVFGHIYAGQATWTLRVLGLAVFPLIVKNHYIAICRIQRRVRRAVLVTLPGVLLELSAAAVGAHLGGLVGLGVGWICALILEAALMFRTVYALALHSSSSIDLSTQDTEEWSGDLDPAYIELCSTMPLKCVKGEKQVGQSVGSTFRVDWRSLPALQLSGLLDTICIILACGALLLWLLSLRQVDVYRMNDLGLISVLPRFIIVALVMLVISYSLALYREPLRWPIIIVHLLLLILILYGTQNLIEEAPRFSIVYRHAGYTEYILRTRTVDPRLDAYFSWPGFFVLSAFITRVAGYQSVISFAGWAPVFYNLIYAGPIYMILSSATTNRRLVALGLWLFYLTNWIGQDYFSPQGFNFFLYLLIIAILLKWFKISPAVHMRHRAWGRQHLGRYPLYLQGVFAWIVAPDEQSVTASRYQRVVLLIYLLAIFAFMVYSHPLTPFFVLVSVSALVLFVRCTPRWLPVVMAVMTAAWIICMTQAFLIGHSSMVVGGVGHLGSNISASVTHRVIQGNAMHTFIAAVRVAMTVLVWGLAAFGVVRRLRKGYGDITYVLLSLAAFSLIVAQPYGGEMMLRVYLFTLPVMLFFAAALFYPFHSLSSYRPSPRVTVAIACTCLVLLAGFFFTRYGNERMDYMTYDEVNGMQYLYRIAPPHSLLLQIWSGSPWQYRDYEKYDCYSLNNLFPDAVATQNVAVIVQYIQRHRYDGSAYIVVTRSQKISAESFSGLPAGTLNHLEAALIRSGQFVLVYSSRDVQILQYVLQYPQTDRRKGKQFVSPPVPSSRRTVPKYSEHVK